MSVYKDLLQRTSESSQHSAGLTKQQLPLPESQVLPIVDQVVDAYQSESTSRFALLGLDQQAGTTTLSRQVAIMLGSRTHETKILLIHGNLTSDEGMSAKPEPLLLDGSPVGVDVISGFPLPETLSVLEREYDIILVDTPPINSPDAMRVLRWVNAVFPIVVANLTAHSTARSAIDRLRSIPVEIMGIVLNRRIYHIPQAIYSRL